MPAESETSRDEAQLEAEKKQQRRSRVASIPATYVDTWTLTTWRGHLRIALGEEFADDDYFRLAVVMELGDAERLANQLLRAIAARKEKDESKGAAD